MPTLPTPFASFKPQAAEDWGSLTRDATARLKALGVGDVDAGLAELLLRVSSPELDFGCRKKLASLVRLAIPHTAQLSPFRKMTIGFVGNATLSFLCAEMAAAGISRSLLVETVEAPFDTAAALAFGVSDGFDGHQFDAIVVYTDAGSLASSQLLDDKDEARIVHDTFKHIATIARSIRDRFHAPVIVPTLVARPDRLLSSADSIIKGTHARLVHEINVAITEGGAQDDWIVWDVQALAHDIGLNQWFDPVRFHQAKAPFSLEYAGPVADHLCALLAAMSGRSRRALVLDLDNTLWGGVIGDDGLHGITLGPGSPAGEAYQAFQAFVLELHRRGVVLAVSSKNEDAIARSAFREHPDMLIREQHISVFQANWTDKASNIRAIAQNLKLGLESLVFVDDNPAECALVRKELPQVAVPHMGEEPALFSRVLSHSRLFEHLNLNSDDLLRVQSYRHNAEMAEVRSSTSDYAAYLQSLQMRMEITPCCDNTHGRITQLINKTNQFNLTSRRYNGEDVRTLMHDSDVLVWQARIVDKFADYGTVAVLIVRHSGKVWDIDSWLQSCRVLERGVEQALMNALIEHARVSGVERITGHYIQTDRNVMVADLYLRLGFEARSTQPNDEDRLFTLDPNSYEPQPSSIEVSVKTNP